MPGYLRGQLDPYAHLRLFCLPYAGAGTSRYYRWAAHVPRELEICPLLLPGREERIGEEPFTVIDLLVESLAEALVPALDRPFALFGHSMGALVAFELARLLRRGLGVLPLALFASGCRAPHLPDTDQPLHHLPPDEFALRIGDMYDAAAEVGAHSEYMHLMLPTVRADFEVCETYLYRAEPALECPISVFGGVDDAKVPRPDLEAWAAETSGGFALRLFAGAHLFLNSCEIDVTRAIVADLSGITK
jgi:medium-chain acyl-[acyl-carrier-protein] hydrolase